MPLTPISARFWRGGSNAAAPAAPAGATASTVTRESDLVLWYKFDENTGTAIGDSSDSEFDATASGGVSWVTGKNGSAASFDGTDDAVICDASTYAVADAMNAHATDATANGAWSVSMWLKYEAYGSGFWDSIFSIGTAGQASEWLQFVFRDGGGGKVYARAAYRAASPWYLDTAAYTPDSNFVNWVITFDGSDWTIYKNGSSAATVTHGMRFGRTGNGEQLNIGNSGYGRPAMELDDFRIYNVALTSDNVTAIYNSGDGDW